ncbi:MAG: hypothetical protein GX640_09875 [Fibrobacter sp.]|nr:hypothetical protein [Fibrobacter sp.]
MKNDKKAVLLSCLAVLTIGDGIMGTVFTKEYMKVWRRGPVAFRNMADFCLDHLLLTKLIGVLETSLGFWIGSKVRSKSFISQLLK